MRNSSLVKCLCAENVTGLKHGTEAKDSCRFHQGFRERFGNAERCPNVPLLQAKGGHSSCELAAGNASAASTHESVEAEEAESLVKPARMVGERCANLRSRTGRSGGGGTSENAGMSSEKAGENPVRRKPKVS